MIANRYLQRDYKKLTDAGVQLKKRLFTLIDIAYERLRLLYKEFDQAGVKYKQRFFDS